jgi:NADPH:quinone reductase-like Zn-dependent oxidoreductase
MRLLAWPQTTDRFGKRDFSLIFAAFFIKPTMRSIQFSRVGLPTEVLELVEISAPEPAAGEVQVRVKARPVNPSDMMYVRGLYGIRPQPPCGAGFEAMGVVEKCGDGVDAALVGKRVSFTALGVWQEYVCVHAKTVIPLPDSIGDETGSQLYVNPFTAWAMLYETGLQAGEWLLQTAGGSAFGQMIIQLAKMRGIRTISTVRRPDQVEHLKTIGADAVVNLAEDGMNLAKQVKSITDGKGVTCALDAVAGATGAEVLKALSYGGVMYCYGALSVQDIPVNAGLLIFKALTMKGFWLTDWLKNTDAATRKQVTAGIVALFATGKLTAPVEAQYDLADIKAACDHAERVGRTGKILLVG